MQCALVKTFEVGDHAVLVGEVRDASYRQGQPLLYFNSLYRRF
jgi:flavin reductase (DIM6/NTAB) family NADH-FMN oxidoreductase RutF